MLYEDNDSVIYVITSFIRCGLPVAKRFLRSIFDFNLKPIDVTLT
jgi:hypothetical protein